MKIEVYGEDLLAKVLKTNDGIHYEKARTCPECQGDCSKTAIDELIYTFELCSCGNPEYPHLIEQLHHRSCYEEAVCHRFGVELVKH